MAEILQQRTASLALGYQRPELYRKFAESPMTANFWRHFSAPARLTALRAAPSLRLRYKIAPKMD